jgi:hypothetical protein
MRQIRWRRVNGGEPRDKKNNNETFNQEIEIYK